MQARSRLIDSPKFWRRLCVLLALVLAIVGWNLAIRTCYPKEWDRIYYGMSGAEVWKLCGEPTVSSGGMKPDYWEKPFLIGTWKIHIFCGDVIDGKTSPVSSIQLYYETVFSKTHIKSSATPIHIVDHNAYARAFGIAASNATD